MTPEEFRSLLEEKDFPITDEKMAQYEQYYEELVEWNEKVNLTAITDKEEVYLKHFYDSLTLALHVDFDYKGPTLCDVGSGAGFPSIPLKIMYPELEVTIVDSLQKRIRFLESLVATLNLAGVSLYHDRAETFGQNKNFRASFDYVTARAVARMSVLSELCLPLVKKNGFFIAMKGSDGLTEMLTAEKAIATLGGKIEEEIIFDLPQDAGERQIFLIEKRKETPNKYPRKPGTPNKNPIE
jgi:16S rRNA (guanine527-N7)-methyltransferase